MRYLFLLAILILLSCSCSKEEESFEPTVFTKEEQLKYIEKFRETKYSKIRQGLINRALTTKDFPNKTEVKLLNGYVIDAPFEGEVRNVAKEKGKTQYVALKWRDFSLVEIDKPLDMKGISSLMKSIGEYKDSNFFKDMSMYEAYHQIYNAKFQDVESEYDLGKLIEKKLLLIVKEYLLENRESRSVHLIEDGSKKVFQTGELGVYEKIGIHIFLDEEESLEFFVKDVDRKLTEEQVDFMIRSLRKAGK